MFNSASASVFIGLLNPKSPQNMGSILRAAGCYQATGIFYTGTRYDRASQYVTDTKKRHLEISPKHVSDMIEMAKTLQVKVVAVELAEGAKALPHFIHPDQVMYIFGPEDGTIEQDILNQCDEVVYIPTIGCMNLAASVNVVLYDRMTKKPQLPFNDELILSSRDTNNRTRVIYTRHPARRPLETAALLAAPTRPNR